MRFALGVLWLSLLLAAPTVAATVEIEPPARLAVEELTLANGMRFLLVERPSSATVAAGWVAAVGSADERPGETGLSHFLEHLLFKGSRAIGVRDPEREEAILAEQDRVFAEIRRMEQKIAAGKGSVGRLAELERRLAELQAQGRSLALLGEFALRYSERGATGLNAMTLQDLTYFEVTLPADKIELWFWLESDRLAQPVFRELHTEKRVVSEERRLTIESTPTGRLDEEVKTSFFRASPYEWRPLGRPEDLAGLGRPEAERFFADHYRAANLTAVLVGGFDRARVGELAERYFGRVPGGTARAERKVSTTLLEPPPRAIERQCSCTPQAQALYPSAPFAHTDSFALQVVAGLLNGRTGRLHRSLVLGDQIAHSASVLQHPLRRAGYFAFSAETRGATPPEKLIQAWDREVRRLVEEPIPASELEKVKNQIATDAWRRLKDPEMLLKQLLIYSGLGDWRQINIWPERILAVTGDEARDAARRYLVPEHRTVALYRRTGESGTGPVAAASTELGENPSSGGR